MRVTLHIFSVFTICCIGEFVVDSSYAARVNPFSQYGQIQNVQNYSSNPLWNPYGPYNQTFPRPVYVDGPDLNSGDCDRAVFALIGAFCAANNNCHGMQLSDVRPSIMLQLSRLPGHNWATQCMGYIDGAFDEYLKSAQNQVPPTPVAFPQGTVPDTQPAQYQIKNPFVPQVPDWAVEMQERKQELEQLQAQNGDYDASVSYAEFPKTYDDLSFAEKINIQQKGYEVYKDKSPYAPIKIDEPEKKTTKSVPVAEIGKLELSQFGEGDTSVTNPEIFDCNNAIEQITDAYFDAHPWGSIKDGICTQKKQTYNDLNQEITNFLKSNNRCNSYHFTKNGFYNWYKDSSKFYAKINVYYKKEGNSYAVSHIDVKGCCDYSVDQDCLILT